MLRKVSWVTTRASLASQCITITLVLAAPRVKPGGTLLFPQTRGLSRAAFAVRSSTQTKISPTLAGSTNDHLPAVIHSCGRCRFGASGQAAAGKAKDSVSSMSDHGQNQPGGYGGSGEACSTSPLQAYLERSFTAVTRPAITSSAHDGRDEAGEGIAKGADLVVHAYAGNEACDADSICSAIGEAFLEDSLQAVIGAGDGSRPRVQHVPGKIYRHNCSNVCIY